MRPSESLKRTQYYQTKKLTQQIAHGNVNCAPPIYSGPPLSIVNGGGSRTQWSRLDPSEIIVHNLKCQDQLDDYIED